MPLDYFVWAIVGADGHHHRRHRLRRAVGTRRGRTTVKPVRDGLAAIGIDPDTVETVIMSHLHYDHSGNTDLFPRARYHLQDCEMEYATGRCMCHPVIAPLVRAGRRRRMVRKVFAGRVDVPRRRGRDRARRHGASHRRPHQGPAMRARRRRKRGPVVIASDATHLYAHIDERPRVSGRLQRRATCWKATAS